MITSSIPDTSHSTCTGVCSDDHLNTLTQNRPSSLYRQLSNDSVDSTTMAVSRMSSLSGYTGSPSFAPDPISQHAIQVDDSALYADSASHCIPPETEILTTRGGNRTFQFPHGLGICNIQTTDKVRVLKTPRVRRRPKAKTSDKNANPIITAPLSQLTQHMHHIPIKDMEAWVNRPIETRRREVVMKNGKIARPMNSFMLYRSAYAERTKQWCSQNNHQVVSRVSGQSWPKEPAEIREKYELLSVIERENHQKAHPEYKFAPNKTHQTPPRKKRSLEDEGSEADESGYPAASDGSPVPHKIIKSSNSAYNSRESSPYDPQDSILSEQYPTPSWSSSVGRQMPSRLMTGSEQHHHGYYMSTHGSFANLLRTSEDTHPSARPGSFTMNGGYGASTGLAGIPGSINQDFLQPYGSSNGNNDTTDGTTTTTARNNINHSNGHVVPERHLDPQLLSSHPNGIDMRPYNLPTLWHPSHQDLGPYMSMNGSIGSNGMTYSSMNPPYGSMQQLEEGQHVWAQGDDGGGIAVPEVGKDFDQWIHSQNPHAVYGSHQ